MQASMHAHGNGKDVVVRLDMLDSTSFEKPWPFLTIEIELDKVSIHFDTVEQVTKFRDELSKAVDRVQPRPPVRKIELPLVEV